MPVHGAQPVSLSCISCRQRKVKCDKQRPCSACQRSSVECVFPPRVRLPRGRQGGSRARNAEITRRLNRLEGLVERLGGENAITASLEGGEAAAGDQAADDGAAEQDTPSVDHPSASNESSGTRDYEPIVQADGSRYLSGDFWTSLSGEVDGLRQLLNQPSDDEEEYENTSSSSSARDKPSPETFFIFRSNVETTDLRLLHPSPPHIAILCDVFFSRVDPLFKVLHKPTVKASILTAAENLDQIVSSEGHESLMFTIYFAAVTSLTQEECIKLFHRDRERLLVHYKYGTEAALANADFLNSMELVTLQAFVIFLMCLRCHSESRSAWTLTSLAVRIGHALDLHRDAAGVALSSFEVEMRRRLWWQINVLDIRASEDRGSPPIIHEHSTKMPSNVNDEDLDPQSGQNVTEKEGGTEMTFCLISHEVCDVVRRLAYVPPTISEDQKEVPSLGLQEKETIVKALSQRLESKYLTHCDTSTPIYWVSSIVARLTMLKMWLLLQYPFQPHQMATRPEASKESILRTAVSILELTDMLETNPAAAQWTWFLTTYVQWHPLAVTLAELCVQTSGPIVERAWIIVDKVFEKWSDRVADTKRGTLWRPIKKLLGKARAARSYNARRTEAQAVVFPETQYWPTPTVSQAQTIPENLESRNPHDALPVAPVVQMGLSGGNEGPLLYSQQQMALDGYIPADVISNMNLEQPLDPVNWGEWDEFIESTWHAGDPIQEGRNMQWTTHFGL